MSILKVNQAKNKLRELFEAHLDLSDIPAHDSDREPKVLTRCLAALAVMLETGCSAKDAAAAVWDGSDDNGIDAAYYDPSESRVLLVQSKWIAKGAGEPEAKEIGTFTKGVWDIIEQDHAPFHARLQARLSDVSRRLAVPGTYVHLALVSTGASTLASHGRDVLDKFLKELNGDDPQAIASADVLGLTEVYSGLASDPSQATVPLDATMYDWSYVATPFPAYFGIIDGLQLKAWWKTHGKRVVSANIRHALGATDVNLQIRQTAGSEPEKFWYFNNGITLIADEALKAPVAAASHAAGNFQFKAASIVNGAQTVSSLGGVDDDEALGKVRVACRVILLSSAPADFGKAVTRTNNLQNRIEPRDFAAQDPVQARLREEMTLENVTYLYVRTDETTLTPTSCDLLEVTTALACAHGDPALAVQVKTGLGRFYNDLTKAPYKTIFNPSTTGARAFNAVQVQRTIDTWIEARKQTVPKKGGPPLGVLVHGNRILAATVFKALDATKLSQPITTFTAALPSLGIEAICESAYQKMLTAVSADYPGKYLAVLFKNPTMSKHVFDRAT
jgi:hypothetical protein